LAAFFAAVFFAGVFFTEVFFAAVFFSAGIAALSFCLLFGSGAAGAASAGFNPPCYTSQPYIKVFTSRPAQASLLARQSLTRQC